LSQALAITKGSALEIPQITGGAWNCAVPDFKGRALGYETVGAPDVSLGVRILIIEGCGLHQSSDA
jgi:hypothetical protein